MVQKQLKDKLYKFKEKFSWLKGCAEYEESITKSTIETDYHMGKGTGIQIALNEIDKILEER